MAKIMRYSVSHIHLITYKPKYLSTSVNFKNDVFYKYP